jgi:hypothetical protein
VRQRNADLGEVQEAPKNNDADSVDESVGRLKFYPGIPGENFIRSNLTLTGTG